LRFLSDCNIFDKSIVDKSIICKEIEMAKIHELLYQVRLADQIITQLFEKQLGISLTRYQILQFLLQKSPCNQIAVQEKLQIDQAALTRHFKVLESENYVSRERNPINQREVLVELTQEAKNQLLVSPPQHHLKVKEQMENILSVAEQQELTTLLTKLVSGLEKIEF
jgi:transcriptional regulator, MarR family